MGMIAMTPSQCVELFGLASRSPTSIRWIVQVDGNAKQTSGTGELPRVLSSRVDAMSRIAEKANAQDMPTSAR